MTMVGWSDAAYRDQPTEGKYRLGYVIGLMSSTWEGPRHILQWTSKLTRKIAKSSSGGEVYALNEMPDHMLVYKNCYGPFEGMNPGVVGLEDCERLRRKIPGGALLEHPTGLARGRFGECVLATRYGESCR